MRIRAIAELPIFETPTTVLFAQSPDHYFAAGKSRIESLAQNVASARWRETLNFLLKTAV
jgi:hypothetical protein